MGYSDREYMQPDYQSGPPSMPGPFEGAPVSKWLLIINVTVLFLQILLTGPGERLQESTFYRFGSFSIQDGLYGFQVWRLITFQFLHAGLGHLFANCLGLLFFGPHIERWMTSRAYLTFYLLCGVAGALFYTLLFFLPGFFDAYIPAVQMVGASAGLFGILAAFYFIAPDARILLFFVIPLKMRTFAIGYLIIESLAVILNWHNAGGSAGHLGGAIFGFAVLKLPPLKEFVIQLSRIGSGTTKKGIKKTRDATVLRESNRSPLELTKEVDRILDKISAQGIQSLTKKEKEVLDKARR
ncbi:rhomboid family intramembrane serine protease [Akkermansiaceae bacterium]|nr:rhomboid family intramembrane serine protease [Akkermansiaceae bacterium]